MTIPNSAPLTAPISTSISTPDKTGGTGRGGGFGTGEGLALVALFSGVLSGVMLKTITATPPQEAIVIRSCLAFVLIAGILALRRRTGAGRIGPRGALRAVLDAIAALTFSLAIFEIPLSLLAAIHATLPVLSVVLSAWVLKEPLRAGHWVALGLACAGTLLILRPGLVLSPYGVGLAVVSTLAYALRDAVTRRLPPRTDTLRIALLSLVLVALAAAATSPPTTWVRPPRPDLILMCCAAAGFVAANVLIIAALRRTALSRIAPLRYSSVLWSLGFDAAIWGYVPDPIAWVGIAVILCAGAVQFRLSS